MRRYAPAFWLALALNATLATALPAHAADEPSAASPTDLPWVNAEVRKVDPDTGKLTLRHEAIPNLDMPGMTMVFQVQDADVLATLKRGDAVRVMIDKLDGSYTVVQLQPVQ